MRLAVVIVNFRMARRVEACLSSLRAAIDPELDQVVVADNGSDDGSAELIEALIVERGWGSWAKLVRLPVNLGFAAGNNRLLQTVDAEFYILLNSDTIVAEDAIRHLLDAAKAEPAAGVIGASLQWSDGSPQTSAFRFPSPAGELLSAAATRPLTRLLARYEIPMPSGDPERLDWVSFACVLIRRELIREIGLLDEGYFLYFDDVDYCRRAGQAGWRVTLCPRARVVHFNTLKTRPDTPGYRPSWYASRARYYAKFHGRTRLWLANLGWMIGRSVSATREVLASKELHLGPVSARGIWTNWRDPLQQRQSAGMAPGSASAWARRRPKDPPPGPPVAPKVAYLINEYPKVSHSFIRREIAALEGRGVDVSRVTIRKPAELVDEADRSEAERTFVLLEQGIAALLVNFLRVAALRTAALGRAARLALRIGWSSDRGLVRHATYLVEACTLLRWLSHRNIGHLHAHFGSNPAAVAMLCRVLGGPPFSFTLHGGDDVERARYLALDAKVARAAFVVAASSWVRSQLLRWCALGESHKIHVVRCGVDASFLNQSEGSPADSRRLVCVARLNPSKGQLILLDAAAMLAASGKSFELLLVGGGVHREEVERRIDALDLGEHVRVTGWATENEVRVLMKSSRVVVLPSLVEGLPLAIVEAFAVGRPVVATAVGAVPELVENGVSGWLVPAGSARALADAMSEALNTPIERLAQMGRCGREAVSKRHDVRQEAAALVELFREAVDGDRRKTARYEEVVRPSPQPGNQRDSSNVFGIVVIGRNEGARLVKCLSSVRGQSRHLVYVDSGSSDASAVRARELGAAVIELDSGRPFTAARARNAGFAELMRLHPDLELVQFVDGDCEIQPGWFAGACNYLNENPEVAIVCGHQRERNPGHSPYNRVADVEWANPAGDSRVVTGTVMTRAREFARLGGFNEEMIAGEEPDLCLRLRRAGLRVVKIDREMSIHDAALANVRQWWRRNVRAGHSYADLCRLHGTTEDPYLFRKMASIALWTVVLPLAIFVSLSWNPYWSVALLAAYAFSWVRIVHINRARAGDVRAAALYASSCIVGRFAELEGVLRFFWSRVVSGRQSPLIEYKKANRPHDEATSAR